MDKILKIKEYIQSNSSEGMSQRLTKAFADFVNIIKSPNIRFSETKQAGFFSTKLYTKFFQTRLFPVALIYIELREQLRNKGLNTIIVHELEVTPEIMDPNYKPGDEKARGIIATITYIK